MAMQQAFHKQTNKQIQAILHEAASLDQQWFSKTSESNLLTSLANTS